MITIHQLKEPSVDWEVHYAKVSESPDVWIPVSNGTYEMLISGEYGQLPIDLPRHVFHLHQP